MRISETKTHPARLGKIARLPADLRQTLNERLEDNEPSQRLVEWLNELPETKEVLDALFEGRPISEQNLSAWKLGGFRDWQRARRACERVHAFAEETRQLDAEIAEAAAQGNTSRRSLVDRVGDRLALTLLQLLHEAEDAEPGPTRTRMIVELAREVARLRRGDQQREGADLAQQRWLAEQEEARRAQQEAEEKKQAAALAALRKEAEDYREEYLRGEACYPITTERTRWIRDYFARHKETFHEHGIRGIPRGEDLCDEILRIRHEAMNSAGPNGDFLSQSSVPPGSGKTEAYQGGSR